jgi:hypothetical protein
VFSKSLNLNYYENTQEKNSGEFYQRHPDGADLLGNESDVLI